METALIITDVTRMNAPRVCVAGITEDNRTVRPILPYPGVQEHWLYYRDEVIIRPFARVTFDLLRHEPQPPHTEDWQMNPACKRFISLLGEEERIRYLERMAVKNVHELFGAPVQQVGHGYFVQTGQGQHSLATIQPKHINFVHLSEENGSIKYRITFVDGKDNIYELTVTDLSFRYYVDHLHFSLGWSYGRIGLNLQQWFNQAITFLRIGLARGFNPSENQPQTRCYLQITGVYTFPDYLEGRCFADFRS